jgi:hypothetical protein
MATKKRTTKPAPKRITKKVTVVELDADKVTQFVGNLTAAINRSNDVIAKLSAPPPISHENTAMQCQTANGSNLAAPMLPPLNVLAQALEAPPSGMDIGMNGEGLKGLLDRAYRMLDAAHVNLIEARNIVANNPGKVYEQPSQRFPLGRIIDPPAKPVSQTPTPAAAKK